MASDAHDIKKHVKVYWIVFGALAVLTVVTVSAASIEASVGMGIFIAMVIAVTKGSLVASFFMHLMFDKNRGIAALLLLCLIFFIVLMVIPTLVTFEAANTGNVP
jgi:cytochrome c oxidase subunit 4